MQPELGTPKSRPFVCSYVYIAGDGENIHQKLNIAEFNNAESGAGRSAAKARREAGKFLKVEANNSQKHIFCVKQL